MSRKILEEIEAMNVPVPYVLPLHNAIELRRRTSAVLQAFQFADPRYFKTRVRLLSEEEGRPGSVWIDYMWMVTISAWWAGGPVIVAGMKYIEAFDRREVMRGVLLIPQKAQHYDAFVGKQPLRSFELPVSPDSMADAIQNLNLFEAENDIVPGNIISPHISIIIFRGNGNRSIEYGGGPLEDPTWINLFETVNQTIAQLREFYTDPEIDAFFSRGLRWGGTE